MASLKSAHRGYEYQDLLIAGRLVDMLLGNVRKVIVDEKLVVDDRFDDLTTIGVDGTRERCQFKHTNNSETPLALDTFTKDVRGLRLDRVISAMLADRTGPGMDSQDSVYRIILRDRAPVDSKLLSVLTIPSRDPGPFLPTMKTVRLGFDVMALWRQKSRSAGSEEPFGSLLSNIVSLKYSELEWACHHLIVEVGAPAFSGDLSAPGVAEQLLLTRMRAEVGAEAYPNSDRKAIDVAAAMISTARSARQGLVDPTPEEILRRAQLRSDFGALSRAHPVEYMVEVLRPSTVGRLEEAATKLACRGGHLLVTGPPGQGKSWVCKQFVEALCSSGWLVAEHYCYLNDADGDRLHRVFEETIFGSLVGRLAEADPRLITAMRPRFAADEDSLRTCIIRSLELEPNRKIALIIDGIDHITRIQGRARTQMRPPIDPSRSLAETLSSLDLLPGTVVIILSQPGDHLEPLHLAGGVTVNIPGLDETEIGSLAARLGVIAEIPHKWPVTRASLLVDEEPIGNFTHTLSERSGGNALYATYLCREVLRKKDTAVDAQAALQKLPAYDGSLQKYYEYLYQACDGAYWVADVIALIDFAVTRAELREIMPEFAHRVDDALLVLKPVLIERATQGGVRVYHESFARYLRESFRDNTSAIVANLKRIGHWLEHKGLFTDSRAFRSLLPILSEIGDDQRVVELVDHSFVTAAVAAGFSSQSITANLATAIGSAAKVANWAAIVRYIELSRAAESYQNERVESTLVRFVDIPASVLGADTLAARLIDNDRLVMPARAGLQMCAAIDALGATAPWREYMLGYEREAKDDKIDYGNESERAVALAWIRGRLRLSASHNNVGRQDHSTLGKLHSELIGNDVITAPINWERIAESVDKLGLPLCDVLSAVSDTHGSGAAIRLIRSLTEPGDACLAFAELLAAQKVPSSDIGSPQDWAIAAANEGVSSGSIQRLLNLGVLPAFLIHDTVAKLREQLLELTRKVQASSSKWDVDLVGTWVDTCVLAAYQDPLGTNVAEATIAGEGWYRCWLRFVLALSKARAAEPAKQGVLALDALRLLTGDLKPFSGEPRACDLYSLHGIIQDTVCQATQLLDDAQWEIGLGILLEVSKSITTSLRGELGGPVPPDFLMELAVSGSNPTRRRYVEALIQEKIVTGSSHRYYADLAEYRLMGARLALIAGDHDRVDNLWHEACSFLTAYGWHKDITIFELLNPLPELIKHDLARARDCVAAVQALCFRIPLHTDGKETRHAPDYWWRLLSKADPVATVHVSVPRLLSECNDPNPLLHSALEYVWQEWHEHVDPFVAGVLRLTLNIPLDRNDIVQLRRLLTAENVDKSTVKNVMTWLLSRADERPVAYGVTNSAELVAKDDQLIAALNVLAESVELPVITAVREDSDTNTKAIPPYHNSPSTVLPDQSTDIAAYAGFPRGLPGLTRAIRMWQRRPFDATSSEWMVQRFANVIGYRIIELLEDGRHNDVESALQSLADGFGFNDRLEVLRAVGEGLERLGEPRLSALAYTLAWTRTRGQGGWLSFGGETEIAALCRASELDPSLACAVVAQEVQRVVASGSGSYGISQALIYAFAVGALTCKDQSSADIAYSAWNEALAVINSRAPRVDVSDDPKCPYLPPELDDGQAVPGDLVAAMALAALGSLAHADRENKRRALLAAKLLLEQRTAISAAAFDIALRTIADPTTLTWLLRLIDSVGKISMPVRTKCQNTLNELISREQITVRALARRLIAGETPPLAPPSFEPLLIGSSRILRVSESYNSLSEDEVGLDELLDAVAGTRLRQGERLLPGLRNAIYARTAIASRNGEFVDRLRWQLRSFGDQRKGRWPDALLAHQELIEVILQSVAAGGRAARIMVGEPVMNPIAWEDDLAAAILSDPLIPLSLEATRQPRPHIPCPPGYGEKVWEHIYKRAAGGSDRFPIVASIINDHFCATLSVQPVEATTVIERGPFTGWYWLGTVERRVITHPDWQRKLDMVARRYRILELRNNNDREGFTVPPVAAGNARLWKARSESTVSTPLLAKSQPLLGIDYELEMVGDSHHGLGVPEFLLVPMPSLIALLNLFPSTDWSYADESGIGLALITWRTEYATSDYHLAWPRTSGCGIVIRPDLLVQLTTLACEQRIVLRDYVEGDLMLLPQHD
jgi:hypothetical protein